MRSSMSLLFVILSGLSSLDAVAQSPGSFVRTGSLTTLRSSHTATLLRDGRVLIAGGQNSGTLATAELYDPSTGTCAPTGNMTAARNSHAAALLSDGRVLIAGGENQLPAPAYLTRLTSAELYDPHTGTFTATGTMSVPHPSPTANLLSNGKVLITGGTSAEIYDPATGFFTPSGPVNEGSGSTVLLNDGRVFIPGNNNGSLYEITGDSLKLAASVPGTLRSLHTTTLLANGKVLIAGGQTEDDTRDNEASLYDPRRGTLEDTGFLLTGRWGHTATLLAGGRVLIAGGYNAGAVAFAEEYDPSTGSFTSLGIQASYRFGHTATVLPDGRVLIAGGSTIPPAELYTPALRAVSSATLNGPLAPESLGSLFGSRLALLTATADPLPLPNEDEVPPSAPTSLGGVSVRLRDSAGVERLAPLYYVSPARIDFEVPVGTAPGDFTLDVLSGPTQLPSATGQIRSVAPGLLTFSDGTPEAYGLRIEPNQTWTVLQPRNTIVLDDRPVYLILYATGTRNHSSLANVQCTIGGVSLPVEYAGPSGAVPGLDQVNIRLTSALKGTGLANLVLTVDGMASNTVSVDIR